MMNVCLPLVRLCDFELRHGRPMAAPTRLTDEDQNKKRGEVHLAFCLFVLGVGLFVFVFPDAGVMLVQVVLTVGVNAPGGVLGV